MYYTPMPRHSLPPVFHLLALATCALLTGCGGAALVQAAGGVLDIALNTSGLAGRSGNGKQPTEIPLRIHAGEQLNTSSDGKPLSLVVRIYSLRSTERLKTLTYEQLTTPEGEKEGLGDDLISARELVLLPGKSYTMQFRGTPETTTIGVAGLFRSPHAGRWKLAFASGTASEIIIGAHACAFTTSSTTQIPDPDRGSASTLSGIRCNR
jgi:type VI secretion system protein VasD